jgi:hephaestin
MRIPGGLFSRVIFCAYPGTLDGNSPPQRKDVDHNFFLLFSVIDENLSWHLDDNIATYCSDPASVDKEDGAFQDSNRMHGQLRGSSCIVTMKALMESFHLA